MNGRKSRTGRWLLGIAGGVALGLMVNGATAQAVANSISASLVAGTTCSGASSAAYTPGGATQAVTLCITSDANVCGGTYILRAASGAENDAFRVTARSLVGSVMTDPNTGSISFPVSIVAAGTIDFGATSPSAASQPPATDLPVATFTIAPQASATNSSYVISLINSGITSTASDCTSFMGFSDNAIAASFTFVQSPTITIAAAPTTLTDAAAQVSTVTVTSNFAPPSNLIVNLTNVMPTDRATTACGSTITILSGETTATCSVTATENTVAFDGNVNASVSVAAGSDYAVGTPGTANVAINDDDLPSVSIGASPASLFDSAGNVSTVTVTLSAAAPTGGFVVNLLPPPANPARFTTTCGTSLTIAAGSTTATCTITATPNTTVGDGDVPEAILIAASGTYTITGPNPAVVTIRDDDIPVISAVCVPAMLTDSAGQSSNCTISSDKALAAPLTVNLSPPAANARYTTTCAATIIVPVGAAGTSNSCTIDAVANTIPGDGSVTASLSVASGSGYTVGGATQNVAINNDDLATISVAVSPTSVTEDSGIALVYTFTASAASAGATAIAFMPPAASGRYTTDCTSPISLPADQTTIACSVTPLDNAVLDGSATATVSLVPSAGLYTIGAPSFATGTITDEDVGMVVLASAPSIVEGDTAMFTISCAGQGIATVGYSFSGSYSPLPGADSTVVDCGTPTPVNVPTSDDAAVNGVRSITLCIDSVGPEPNVAASRNQSKRLAGKALVIDPAQQCATVDILDNDRPNMIPTMNSLGLVLLGLLLAAAAGFGIRRKA